MGAASSAAFCTGRKEDDVFLEQTLASFACGAPPPYLAGQLQKRSLLEQGCLDSADLAAASAWEPIIQSLHPSFGLELRSVLEDDPESEPSLPENLDEYIDALLAAYASEVHDGHGLLTAADSYYFALLEFQRRHDSVGIQTEAVRRILDSTEVEAYAWRERLAEKRSEAVEALGNRAQHYAIGRRSSQGLLQITSGACAESTLRDYEELLDKEYDLAAQEIEATLCALNAEQTSDRLEHAASLLDQLGRGSKFWISQIEETFEVWQTASMRLNQAQVKRNGAWGELLPAVQALLLLLQTSPRPGVDRSYSPTVANQGAVAARTQCCVRLMELDLHQYAHGLSSAPRRQLLTDLLSSAREDIAMPGVAAAFLNDVNFRALESMQIGDSGHGILDVQTTPSHPWAAVMAELFGELLCAVCETSPRSQVELLGTVESFMMLQQQVLREVRQAAAAYARTDTFQTPLHQATRCHNAWLCEHLLEHKANPLACDSNGCSPLSMAQHDITCPASLRGTLQRAGLERQQCDASRGEA